MALLPDGLVENGPAIAMYAYLMRLGLAQSPADSVTYLVSYLFKGILRSYVHRSSSSRHEQNDWLVEGGNYPL